MNFFNNPQMSLDPLNFLGIMSTVIVSIYIFKSGISISFVQERHDKLIYPLFNILEPILYQKSENEILENALALINQHKNLADGKLLELEYCCKTRPTHQDFIRLCLYADFSYDKSCKKLKLKRRSFVYRMFRRQYPNNLFFALYFFLFIFYQLLLTAPFLISFFIVLIYAFHIFANSSAEIQNIYILLFLVLLLLLNKFYPK